MTNFLRNRLGAAALPVLVAEFDATQVMTFVPPEGYDLVVELARPGDIALVTDT